MARKTKRTATPAAPTPMPIHAQEDDEFRPVALVLEDRSQTVASVDERCEVEEDCWKDYPLVRMYYRVTLEDGQELTIFRNMVHGGWYRL